MLLVQVILCQPIQIRRIGQEFFQPFLVSFMKERRFDHNEGLTTLKDSLITADVFFKV